VLTLTPKARGHGLHVTPHNETERAREQREDSLCTLLTLTLTLTLTLILILTLILTLTLTPKARGHGQTVYIGKCI
jgi:H+/Cl- antiporter ClcA